MLNKEKQINGRKNYNNKNKIINSKFSSPIFYKLVETNEYIPMKTETEIIKNKINHENLTYKSIFPKKEKEDINNINNNINENRTNVKYNINKNSNKEIRDSNYYSLNNNIIYLNKQNQSPKKKREKFRDKLNFSKEENLLMKNSEIKQKTNNNDLKRNINIKENNLNNNKKYINVFNKEKQNNMKTNVFSKEQRNINTQNNEDNLDKILNKNDFIKIIKEIDDLNYLDEIDKKNFENTSKTQNINNLISNRKYSVPSTGAFTNDFAVLKKNPFTSKNPKKSNFNYKKNNLDINTKDIIQINSDINEINKSEKKTEPNQYKKYKSKLLNHLKTYSKGISSSNSNKTYQNGLILNLNSFNNINDNNNYSFFKETNRLSTISQNDEQIQTVTKNLSMKYKDIIPKKIIKYTRRKTIKSDNLPNEFTKSMMYNNYTKKIGINSGNNVLSELKGKIKQLNNVINNKNEKINIFTNIINENREKNEILIKNNMKLREENKKIKELLMKYKNQLLILSNRKTQNNITNKDLSENNVNINYNYITNNDQTQAKIKELEQEIEKYKKENNDLRLLLNKYKNNNYEEQNTKENLINKFNKSDYLYEDYRKKSYSVSKSKKIIKNSIFLSKTFQEDQI